VNDAIKGFEKVDNGKSKMLKQVQHDRWEIVMNGRQLECRRVKGKK
jgi:hypothetical protein